MSDEHPPAREGATLSRGKAIAYSVILAAGVVAAIGTGVQYVNSRRCDTCAKKRAAREVATMRPLITDFVVPVLRYAGDSAGLDALRAHAATLRAQGYAFVSVSQITGALRERGRLPEKCVAVVVEAGGKLPVPAVRALVADAGIPLSVFVSPARAGDPGMLTWDDMMALQAHGAEFHCLDVRLPNGRSEKALQTFRNKTQRTDLHLLTQTHGDLAGAMKRAADAGLVAVWYPGNGAVRAEDLDGGVADGAPIKLPYTSLPERADEEEVVERVMVLSDRTARRSNAGTGESSTGRSD